MPKEVLDTLWTNSARTVITKKKILKFIDGLFFYKIFELLILKILFNLNALKVVPLFCFGNIVFKHVFPCIYTQKYAFGMCKSDSIKNCGLWYIDLKYLLIHRTILPTNIINV